MLLKSAAEDTAVIPVTKYNQVKIRYYSFLEKRELKEVSLLMEVKEFLVGIHIYPRKQEK